MRLREPVHALQPIEDVVADSVDDLLVLAVHVCVKAAEGGKPRGGSGAAEKAVALDECGRAARTTRGDCGSDARRPAAKHHDLEFADHRRAARRFVDRLFHARNCRTQIFHADLAAMKAFACLLMAAVLATTAHAQTYPAKPLRMLVGYSAGG